MVNERRNGMLNGLRKSIQAEGRQRSSQGTGGLQECRICAAWGRWAGNCMMIFGLKKGEGGFNFANAE